jgi:DNA replication protein DnaC
MRTEQRWIESFQSKYIKETFTPRIAYDLEKLNLQFLPQESKSTFIYGKIQTGKTIRAACLMVQQAKYCYLNEIERGTHIFVSFPEMLAEIRETFNNPKKLEHEVMGKYLNADLLTIDDFLTSRPTEWVLDILYWLINHRYENLLKTIITSNISLDEIEERMNDQRITSRINRMCDIELKTEYKI